MNSANDGAPFPSALPPPAFIKFPRPRPETRSTSQATSLHEMVERRVIVKTTAPPPLGPIPAGPLLAQFERHPLAAPSRCHPSHPRWAPPIPPAVSIGYLLSSSRPSPMEMFCKNMEILRTAGQSRRPGICFLRRLQCLPQRVGLPTRTCTHRRLRSETIGSSFHFGNNLWEIRARRALTTICLPKICVAAAPLQRPMESFLSMDDKQNPVPDLANMNFQVRQLPPRQKSALRHGYHAATRLGPRAHGSLR